ncbi:sigma-70 family RNA polymerase sigma factor [Gemella cuniculi]|uniref:sigma-70 family RNA polymerase sigma factor n=1 Tax=Gemella cuniculi TaxID=150240 RepID=UPI00042449C6|nr:sigma-70 family RNA polymerase sigma factor [Gemella cuniculi]
MIRKYLYVKNEKIFVDEDIYKAVKSIDNRFNYLVHLDIENQLIHISSHDTEDTEAINLIRDSRLSPYKVYEEKVLTCEIHNALNKLSDRDKRIILALFFENKSLRQVAEEENTYAMNISRRKKKILKELKDSLNILEDFVK